MEKIFDINLLESDHFAEIIVSGEIDASSSIHLDDTFENALAAGHHLLINLEDLRYISSAGLGVFISHLDDVRSKNLRMILFGLNEHVLEVFQILGLGELLQIVNTKEEALVLLNEA